MIEIILDVFFSLDSIVAVIFEKASFDDYCILFLVSLGIFLYIHRKKTKA